MKSSRRENIKVAAVEKNEALLSLWSFVLYSLAVAAAFYFVALRIAAILGLF